MLPLYACCLSAVESGRFAVVSASVAVVSVPAASLQLHSRCRSVYVGAPFAVGSCFLGALHLDLRCCRCILVACLSLRVVILPLSVLHVLMSVHLLLLSLFPLLSWCSIWPSPVAAASLLHVCRG